MLIGTKFCGGCNPRYDRGQYYKDTMAANPVHTFELAQEGTEYDSVLVIGGCPACCASYSEYTYKNLKKVWPDATAPEIITEWE